MKKTIPALKELNVQLYQRLGKNTVAHFNNKGKYGVNFEEIKIQYNGSTFRVLCTDGYKDTLVGHYETLKGAISLGRLHLDRCK